MIRPLSTAAFHATPEELWRTASQWEPFEGDYAEWLEEIAGDILEARALPEIAHPYEIVRAADEFPF